MVASKRQPRNATYASQAQKSGKDRPRNQSRTRQCPMPSRKPHLPSISFSPHPPIQGCLTWTPNQQKPNSTRSACSDHARPALGSDPIGLQVSSHLSREESSGETRTRSTSVRRMGHPLKRPIGLTCLRGSRKRDKEGKGYARRAYLQPNQHNAYSVNSITARKGHGRCGHNPVRRVRRQNPQLPTDYAGMELHGTSLPPASRNS